MGRTKHVFVLFLLCLAHSLCESFSAVVKRVEEGKMTIKGI